MTALDRDNAICQAYLLWLYENNTLKPGPAQFLELGVEVQDGSAIASGELERSVEYLRAARLVIVRGSLSKSMPLRTWLADDGIRCVREFGGDVRAWSRRHSTNVDQSVNVNALGNANVIAHSDDVAQVRYLGSVNLDELAEAARAARDSLHHLVLTAEKASAIREASDRVLAETSKPDPDPDQLRTRGDKLKAAIQDMPLLSELLIHLLARL